LQNQQVLCSWSIKAHSANNVALGDQEHWPHTSWIHKWIGKLRTGAIIKQTMRDFMMYICI
jgi:hypothetical protein